MAARRRRRRLRAAGLSGRGKTQRGWPRLPAVVPRGGRGGGAAGGSATWEENIRGGGGRKKNQRDRARGAGARPRPARTRLTHAQPRPGGGSTAVLGAADPSWRGTHRAKPSPRTHSARRQLQLGARRGSCRPRGGALARVWLCVAVGQRAEPPPATIGEATPSNRGGGATKAGGPGGSTVRLAEPVWPQVAHAMAGRPRQRPTKKAVAELKPHSRDGHV